MKKETDPGVEQNEPWTHLQRQTLWVMFVKSYPRFVPWFKISIAIGKSIKACKTEVWKMYRAESIAYWQDPERMAVTLKLVRDEEPFKEMDVKIIGEYDRNIPITRLAELLGRNPTSVFRYMEQFRSKGRKPLFED